MNASNPALDDGELPYDIVVIVSSFGGVEALQEITRALPQHFPIPVVIVQHRSTHGSNVLARVLDRFAPLEVRDVKEGDKPLAGAIYVAPPGLHLWLDGKRRFHLADGRRINYTASAGDPLFLSAARVFGGRVIAVVLTGTGRNGARGVRAIKRAGGTVIVQDYATSRSFDMPQAAIETGAVDAVLPLREIAPALVRLASGADVHEPKSGAAD